MSGGHKLRRVTFPFMDGTALTGFDCSCQTRLGIRCRAAQEAMAAVGMESGVAQAMSIRGLPEAIPLPARSGEGE